MLAAIGLVLLFGAGAALFARRTRLLVRLLALGRPSETPHDTGSRLKREAVVVLGQKKLLQRIVPGLMHAFIFWGFLVLLPTIVIAMIAAVDREGTLPWLGHQGWFALLVDVFVVLVLVGVAAAVWIRKGVRPRRFGGRHLGEADF